MQRRIFQQSLADKETQGVYLLYGDEPYLLDQIRNYLKNSYLDPSTASLNISQYFLDEVSGSDIIEACETLPLFSDRRIVVIESCDFSRNGAVKFKDNYEDLIKYFERIPDYLLLIMISSNKTIFKGRFVKAGEKYGHSVSFMKMEHGSLQNFINKRLGIEGKRIDSDAVLSLIRRSAYLEDDSVNLYDIENILLALAKLSKNQIKLKDIEEMLEMPFTDNIFQLTDAIAEKNFESALSIYDSLRKGGEDFFPIFYMLVRQIRNLIQVKAFERKPVGNGPKTIGISPYEYGKLKRIIKFFKFSNLYDMHRAVYNTESDLKSSPADPDTLMTLLLFDLCK